MSKTGRDADRRLGAACESGQGRLVLQQIVDAHPNEALQVRGRGMILGLDVGQGAIARQIIDRCFADGLLIESSGADDEVLKFMGALNIPEAHLRRGMQILQDAVAAVLDQPV